MILAQEWKVLLLVLPLLVARGSMLYLDENVVHTSDLSVDILDCLKSG